MNKTKPEKLPAKNLNKNYFQDRASLSCKRQPVLSCGTGPCIADKRDTRRESTSSVVFAYTM